MQYLDTVNELAGYRRQIAELREKMRKVQQSVEPQAVPDYTFATTEGTVHLSDLFDGKDSLFVIHNMGASCAYCTLWADGFNGILPHLENRAAFVVSSPDDPAAQRKFKESRGWRFRMVSHKGTKFAADMGYSKDNRFQPGVSVFRKQDGKIVRVSDAGLGPGDDFCALWHFFDLLPEGADGWRPRFSY